MPLRTCENGMVLVEACAAVDRPVTKAREKARIVRTRGLTAADFTYFSWAALRALSVVGSRCRCSVVGDQTPSTANREPTTRGAPLIRYPARHHHPAPFPPRQPDVAAVGVDDL